MQGEHGPSKAAKIIDKLTRARVAS